MSYGRMRGNKREVTIGTAHTVTVDSLIESDKQTNKHIGQVRALDTEHVYIRVNWLNRPEDLKNGCQD
jgi:hypothetical protein